MIRDSASSAVLREFARLCRQRGLALTIQRQLIFAVLVRRRDHPTADQMYALVRRRLPGISRATVYRVLETLARAGLIAKACHPGTAARYDPCTHQHHHLVCTRCGRMTDLEDPRLDRLPRPQVSRRTFRITDYCVHFRGLCRGCLRSVAVRRTPRRARRRSGSAPGSSGRGQP